ncbi:MMPL family transporter [Streptomyces canus]|uniref:MMPL family transporter n=1 Tax=Streptomyces canus TaxID=58343 RepID=UPI00278B9417|nr:MMPL family transporter [Streptomyces canus]MDQ1066684.1 hypothetical protein [Streptomyces canus]
MGNIEPNVPITLFAPIFGLSMDCEVFLVSRMREQYDQLGDRTEAVATVLGPIGRLTMSAAVLMCVPLAAIGMSGVLTIQLFGVGMVFAALTDVLVALRGSTRRTVATLGIGPPDQVPPTLPPDRRGALPYRSSSSGAPCTATTDAARATPR